MNRAVRVQKLEQLQPKAEERHITSFQIVDAGPLMDAYEITKQGQESAAWIRCNDESEDQFMQRVNDEVRQRPGNDGCWIVFSGRDEP